MTLTGLDCLISNSSLNGIYKGNVAYLCHNASVDRHCREGLALLKSIFGARLKAVFSPQHGLFGEAQDNMIESGHFVHPFYKIPVYSLYSETRSPTPSMLEGIDHVFIDLQDAGCRAYTFIYTMALMMQACGPMGIEVIVLDRPNPLGGIEIEGSVLDEKFKSFIGMFPLPMRHGLTIGEVAQMAVTHWGIECKLQLIKMQNWSRSMHFGETKLPWVLPSPNMPHIKTAKVFPGMVLWEGTNFSEGRGTTRPFEIFGHPALKPHHLLGHLSSKLEYEGLRGFALRPLHFQPTFDKHTGTVCGGYQIHITDWKAFKPWKTGLVILRELYHDLGNDFAWRQPPFEYEEHLLPIDMLNGTDRIRKWVEANGNIEELIEIEMDGREGFMAQRENTMLYL